MKCFNGAAHERERMLKQSFGREAVRMASMEPPTNVSGCGAERYSEHE